MSGSDKSKRIRHPVATKKIVFIGLTSALVILIVFSVAASLSSTRRPKQSPVAQAIGVEQGGPLVGKPAPDFTLTSVNSSAEHLKLSQFVGHPVVLNFFASWCIPCKTELPEFAAASRKESGKVDFIGVDENDTRSAGSAILRSSGVDFPAAFDGEGQLASRFHLVGLPTTFFINSKGTVVAAVAGQLTSAVLNADIARIIGS